SGDVFFFQAEDGIRDKLVTGVQTCALPIWIREFDLDGFRCDVAEEVPTEFWENARVELDQIKPDIVMLAEGHKAELLRKAFDFRSEERRVGKECRLWWREGD